MFNCLILFYSNCAATKLKSQSLPLGINPKLLEKHSLPSAKEVKTTITATTTNMTTTTTSSTTISSSKLSSMYVNKTLSKSYDFESRDSNVMATTISESNTSTLERKDDDGAGFFRRLLNRSTKKKKSIDDTDANALGDRSIIVPVVPVVPVVPSPTKEPPPPIKAKPNVKDIPRREKKQQSCQPAFWYKQRHSTHIFRPEQKCQPKIQFKNRINRDLVPHPDNVFFHRNCPFHQFQH